MADEETTTSEMDDSQDEEQAVESQDGEMPQQRQQDDDSNDAPDPEAMAADLREARSALKKANRESAERRKKLEAYEKAEQERKEAELSEMERLQKKLDEAESARQQAEQAARETLIRSAFVSEAAKVGATNPADAYALAMADGAEIEVEDGKVSGIVAAVKALLDAGRLPLQKARAPNLNGGAGGGQRASDTKAANLTDAELTMARRMNLTPEQYMAAKEK